MLQITPQIQVDQYYESDALSQSTLKNLIKGLDYFLDQQEKEEDEKNDSFVIGSAVDCILTGNDEDFGNKFHISNMENSPSDAEMEIVNLVFQVSEESRPTLEEYPEEILQACLQTGWQKNYKDQTKIDKIIEKGSLYFEELRRSYGKTIITAEQNRLIDTIVKSLRESNNTKNFFDRELYSNLENYTMFLQYPIYFKIDSTDCKALLDMLICEVEDEILVLYPIDIKTTRFFTIDFPNAVRTYRYDLQAAWYTEALWSIKDKLLKEFNCKHLIINNGYIDYNFSPLDYLLYFSKAFIDFYNLHQNYRTTFPINVLLKRKILLKSVIKDNKYFILNNLNEDEINNEEYEGLEMFKFKGVMQYLHINEGLHLLEEQNIIYTLSPIYISTIKAHILNVLNYTKLKNKINGANYGFNKGKIQFL